MRPTKLAIVDYIQMCSNFENNFLSINNYM